MRGYGIEPRVVFRSDDNPTVQGLVSAHVGSAVMPRLAIDATDESTVALDLESDVSPRIICLAWHRDRYRSAAARAFVTASANVCAAVQGELGRIESQPVAILSRER